MREPASVSAAKASHQEGENDDDDDDEAHTLDVEWKETSCTGDSISIATFLKDKKGSASS